MAVFDDDFTGKEVNELSPDESLEGAVQDDDEVESDEERERG